MLPLSWDHPPTVENGWRLRDPTGGDQSYVTARRHYLVHLSPRCPDCLIFLRAMEDALLRRFAGRDELVNWHACMGALPAPRVTGRQKHLDETTAGLAESRLVPVGDAG